MHIVSSVSPSLRQGASYEESTDFHVLRTDFVQAFHNFNFIWPASLLWASLLFYWRETLELPLVIIIHKLRVDSTQKPQMRRPTIPPLRSMKQDDWNESEARQYYIVIFWVETLFLKREGETRMAHGGKVPGNLSPIPRTVKEQSQLLQVFFWLLHVLYCACTYACVQAHI